MGKTGFVRQRYDTAKRIDATGSPEKRRFLKRQSVLCDNQTRVREVQPEPIAEKKSPITQTAKKLWRWALLSTPFIPACSVTKHDMKDNLGYFVLGGFVVVLGIGAIVEQTIIQRRETILQRKEKKEKINPLLPGDNIRK